jgi:hypothetical protein
MAKFMIAHLEGGRSNPILSDTIRRLMNSVQFRNHPRLPGMTYGFMEKRLNGYRALQHGGSMSGFKASLWLWPEQRMGLFLAYNREFDVLEQSIVYRFAARVLTPPLDSLDREETRWTRGIVRTNLDRFAGQYRQETYCHTCTGDRGWVAQAFDVKVLNDTTLTFWGGHWMQVEPMLFRLMNGQFDYGQLYAAFKSDASGSIIGLATGGPWFNERLDNSRAR